MKETSTDQYIKALASAIQAYRKGDETYQINLADFDLRVYLKGPRWSGLVDRPVAKFLLEFDARIRKELDNVGFELPKVNHGLVALNVKEGSLDAALEFSKEFITLVKTVPLEAQIAMFSAVLVALGIWKGPDWITALKSDKLEKIKKDGEKAVEEIRAQAVVDTEVARGDSNDKLLSRIEGIVAASRDLQAPLRTNLINNMTPADKIELPAGQEPLTKAQATGTLVKGTRSKPVSLYIDHVYIIQSINMKKAPYEVSLEYGEINFTARLIISKKESDSLWNAFKEAHIRGKTIAEALQVNARINGKGEVIDAEVTGLGKPRSNSKTLSEALRDAEED